MGAEVAALPVGAERIPIRRRAAIDRPADVLVAIPAHDEQDTVEACLISVLASIGAAREGGAIDRAAVAVAADRCTDRTAVIARRVLAGTDLPTMIWSNDRPMPVGMIRTALIRRAAAQLGLPLDPGTWVFSTDADTSVPAGWIADGLAFAGEEPVLLGLVDLAEDARISHEARAAHDRIVAAGINTDGSHNHAYAANLAVRADAFTRLGGFPAVANGEERALAVAAREAGLPVRTSARWRVTTSARTTGRAAGGLAALLHRLDGAGSTPG